MIAIYFFGGDNPSLTRAAAASGSLLWMRLTRSLFAPAGAFATLAVDESLPRLPAVRDWQWVAEGSAVNTDPSNLWLAFFVCISIGGGMAANNLCVARTTLVARHMARWRTSERLPITTKAGPVKAVEASR